MISIDNVAISYILPAALQVSKMMAAAISVFIRSN